MDIAKSLAVYRKAIDLRAQRHEVLASNIANADTPNYKARDFDFSEAMKGAASRWDEQKKLGLAHTSSRHFATQGGGADYRLQFRNEYQSAVDGNTVEMDVERAQIADNALQYQILTQLIGSRFQGLRTAMSGTQG
ncbi:flagellar basal body rod protein FlgB [Dechloromonas sp. ZY10]|uniref:flagellar basal body rod protein FlgB n=1 Tax=Dechloromonas aquae TaxID=2664436 RepID=UPI0035295001